MKKSVSVLLAILFMVLLVSSAFASGGPYEYEVYNRIMAQQSQYPEGMPWGDNDVYYWYDKLGYSVYRGWACQAFAMRMSDAGFGTEPGTTKLYDFSFDQIRVGDLIRIKNDTHTVIVLEVHDDYVVVAEGKYSNAVHWGRHLDRSVIMEPSNYLVTRYPTVYREGWEKTAYGWTYYQSGTKVLGWVEDGGDWYYIDPATELMIADTTRTINGIPYRFNSSGAWVESDTEATEITSDSSAAGRWILYSGGRWAYLFDSGSWAYGWQLIDGIWYYFDSEGWMLADTVVDGYRLDASGAWIP